MASTFVVFGKLKRMPSHAGNQPSRIARALKHHQILKNIMQYRKSVTIAICITGLLVNNISLAKTDVWINNGDGTVVDVATGLIWQQQDDGVRRNHSNAIAYCQGLNLAGLNDWRLPNIKELASILDFRFSLPNIDRRDFLGTPLGGGLSSIDGDFWSTTMSVEQPESALTIDFENGETSGGNKVSGILFTRCVHE